MLYAVGRKFPKGNDHIVVEAEDALVAALKAKLKQPDASITYVRRNNKRGDARHPVQAIAERNG